MHEVASDLQERIERNLKSKIYREMLDEQLRFKRNYQNETRRQSNPEHFRTQPQEPLHYRPRENDEHGYLPLRQESVFLPVLDNPRKEPRFEDWGEESPSRRMNAQRPEKYARETGGDEIETQKYLTQCERIIENLREINNKQLKKQRNQESYGRNSLIYTPVKESHYRQHSTDFGANSQRVTLTPLSHLKKGNQKELLRISIPEEAIAVSKGKQLMSKKKQVEYAKPTRLYAENQFENQFSDSLKTIQPKAKKTFNPPQESEAESAESSLMATPRQNDTHLVKNNMHVIKPPIIPAGNRNVDALPPISPKKSSSPISRYDPDSDLASSSLLKSKSKSPIEKQKAKLQTSPRASSRTLQNEKSNEKELLKTSKQAEVNEEQAGEKNQTAVVAYLKKAKLKGKLLFQKIEGFKKQRNGVEATGNQGNQGVVNEGGPATKISEQDKSKQPPQKQ